MTHATATPPGIGRSNRGASGEIPAGIGAAFDALDRAGGSWALLRGAADLADDLGDVDVLLAPEALPKARGALIAAGFVPLPGPGRGSHRFFYGYDPAADRWTKLDLVTELAFGRFQEWSTDLAAGCLVRRDTASWPPRLDPDDEFWTFLLHLLLDRAALRPGDPAALIAAAGRGRADGPAAAGIAPLLPRGWSPERALELARVADPAALGRVAQGIRRASLRRAPLRVGARLVGNRILRRTTPIVRAIQSRGMSVAILGPDGAGKSTLAVTLAGAFPVPVRRIYLGLYGHGAGGGGAGPSGRFGLPGRLAWLWRRSLDAAWQRLRGRIVVFDRHVLDLALAAPGSGPKARLRRRLLVRSVPTPGLSLILDVPGEELFRRKGEHDPASLEIQRARYLELGQRLRHATVIDAATDPETVRRRSIDAIWTAWAARLGVPDA